jgi:hypothetical protein
MLDPFLTDVTGRAVTGTSIMGVFNISARPLTDLIPLSRFPGVLSSMTYIVRAHSSGKVTVPLKTDSSASLLAVSLDVRGHEILCAYPLSRFYSETRGDFSLANLGLLGKMTGCAAVLSSTSDLLENGRMLLETTVKTLGVLGKLGSHTRRQDGWLTSFLPLDVGLYISCLPELSIEGNFMVTIQGQAVPPKTVSISKVEERVLEVDIETAWKEMGLDSGWANEVAVKIYF